ncbi:hypothetical protein DFH09DRAFT_1096564 [Mycena vulgaris]|nr:hypothetical protein DFH09DRAFT_1096564 [Mycena vulgaris]
MALSPKQRLSEFCVAANSTAVRFPFDFRDQLGPMLEIVRAREKAEPYYRGETLDRPSEREDSSSESEDDELDSGDEVATREPTSSEVGSSPPRSSSPVASASGRASSPSPYSSPSPPRRYAPYLRCFGFGLPLVRPPIPPMVLRPRPLFMPLKPNPTTMSRAHMRSLGFRTYNWDMQATPFIDTLQRTGAVMIGAPTEAGAWETHIMDATGALRLAENRMDRAHMKDYILRDGLQYGGLRSVASSSPVSERDCLTNQLAQRPQNVENTLENLVVIHGLRTNPGVKAVVAFQNEMYRLFWPQMFDAAVAAVQRLREYDDQLRLPFDVYNARASSPPSGFTSIEYDFAASNTKARRHDRDAPGGMRALTICGDFDTRFNGDIIFWGSKFIAPFPPGSTISFPAWWMPYSFTQVDRDEDLFVISQHMDAGMYRFVNNGLQSDRRFETLASREEVEAVEGGKARQLEEILGMLPNVGDLAW